MKKKFKVNEKEIISEAENGDNKTEEDQSKEVNENAEGIVKIFDSLFNYSRGSTYTVACVLTKVN